MILNPRETRDFTRAGGRECITSEEKMELAFKLKEKRNRNFNPVRIASCDNGRVILPGSRQVHVEKHLLLDKD
ncbi:MAG: hypothetical protein ACTSWN_01445 [Promethearchaeota archaeon]